MDPTRYQKLTLFTTAAGLALAVLLLGAFFNPAWAEETDSDKAEESTSQNNGTSSRPPVLSKPKFESKSPIRPTEMIQARDVIQSKL